MAVHKNVTEKTKQHLVRHNCPFFKKEFMKLRGFWELED